VDQAAQPESIAALTSSYEGLYYSSELGTAYEVVRKADILSLHPPRGVVAMEAQAPDIYAAKGNFSEGKFAGTVEFTRTHAAVTGLLLTSAGGRAAKILFARTTIPSSDFEGR